MQITDVFKTVVRRLFGKAAKQVARTAAKTAATKAATTTGEYAGKKAGDKIIELLSKKGTPTPSKTSTPLIQTEPRRSKPEEMTAQEVNERVNQILSGGKMKRRNSI